jgi:hypothetical protein
MKKWIFCFCLFLPGCAGYFKPVNIAVPVVAPLPDFPVRPPLAIQSLKAGASCGEALTAAGSDINMLLRRESAAKEFLEKYKK